MQLQALYPALACGLLLRSRTLQLCCITPVSSLCYVIRAPSVRGIHFLRCRVKGILKCRGPENIGRVAVEGLGAAAWHLGMPAPEQSRQLLLAVTNISTMIRKAQCSAVITIPAGDHLVKQSCTCSKTP